jgi:ribosomal protein S18 acetylase RimI-like enzyme
MVQYMRFPDFAQDRTLRDVSAMQIRILEAADAGAFQALRLRGLRESPAAFGSTLEEEAGRSIEQVAERLIESRSVPRRTTFGAFDDNGSLLGVVACVQQSGIKSRHKASVFAMYVSPEARGRGVGRALVARLIDDARGWNGVDRLTLTVTDTQAAARALYLAAGFQVFGSEPDGLRENGQPTTVEYMTLSLRDA